MAIIISCALERQANIESNKVLSCDEEEEGSGCFSAVDLFYVFLSCVCYVFVRVCLIVPCGNLLEKG